MPAVVDFHRGRINVGFKRGHNLNLNITNYQLDWHTNYP